MNQKSKVAGVVLFVVFCASLLTNISKADISSEELQKIKDAAPSKATAVPQKARKLLVFTRCEGFKHSAIPYGTAAIEIMGQKTGAYEVVVSDDMSMFQPANLKQFDAICLNNTTRLKFDDPQLQKSLIDFVRGGKGIVGIHGSTDNFYEWRRGQGMMGGLFDGHPWRSKGTWAVKIDDPEHPLTAAFKGEDFKIKEEIYRIKGFSRSRGRVLLSLDMTDKDNLAVKDLKITDKDIPISWVRSFGKGRVFYCSLGHNHEIFWNPAVLQHYLDGIQFAAGDLKVDTTPSLAMALKALAKYQYGQSRKPLSEIVEHITSLQGSPKRMKRLEKHLVEMLESGTTPAGRQFICRQLSIIGTEQSVPTLAAMLTEKATSEIEPSDMARYALERIPGEAVNNALRDALAKTSGKVKIGIINSLGQRRDVGSVAALSGLIYDSDKEVAAAAVSALGKTAGPDATAALAKATDRTTGNLRLLVLDAYLECADDLKKRGNNAQALAIYNRMYKATMPTVIRIAALRGILLTSGDNAGDMIIDVLKGKDQAMQVVAIGLIKEISAANVVKAVTAEMSNLSVSGQVQLLSALAESKDSAALPAVIESTKAANESVRIAAVKALATLGGPGEVELLAQAAAKGGELGTTAAESLDRLSGDRVNAAILANTLRADAEVRVVLIQSLATRQYAEAVPVLLKFAQDRNASIRRESFKSLGVLANENALPDVINLLLQARKNADRTAAEKTVLAVCKRVKDPQKRTQALLSALDGADVAARASLLGVLGYFSDEKALDTLTAALNDSNEDIRYAAIRTLANNWPGAEPAETLIKIAQSSPSQVHRILALRGYIRMVGLVQDRPAAEAVKMYQAAMAAAARPEEKKLILAGISNVQTADALKFIEPHLDDKAVRAEAEVAYMALALAIKSTNPQASDAAIARLEQLTEMKSNTVRPGAETIILPVAGIITPPLVVQETADGMAYMVVPTLGGRLDQGEKGGRAVFSFGTAAKGKLVVEFYINGASNDDDSWYIKLDDNDYVNWNDNVTKGWEWRKFREFDVEKGKHLLLIDQREDGAKMAKIKLTLK